MTTGAPELHPIPVKSPWYHVGIDFIGPISPTADDGSRYILTLSDYCTKWVEAIPTPDKSASSVATVFFKVCLWYSQLLVCVCLLVVMLSLDLHEDGYTQSGYIRPGTGV